MRRRRISRRSVLAKTLLLSRRIHWRFWGRLGEYYFKMNYELSNSSKEGDWAFLSLPDIVRLCRLNSISWGHHKHGLLCLITEFVAESYADQLRRDATNAWIINKAEAPYDWNSLNESYFLGFLRADPSKYHISPNMAEVMIHYGKTAHT